MAEMSEQSPYSKLFDDIMSKFNEIMHQVWQTWEEIGYDESEMNLRCNLVRQRIQQLFEKMIKEASSTRAEFMEKVEHLLAEVCELGKEVGMPQVKDYDSNKLKNAKRYLEQKVEEYCEIKKQRMDRLARYKTQELALCEELGIPRRPDFSGVPTNEQLDEYESYLAEKKEEKELALCEELGIPRRPDFSGVPTNEQLDEDESYLAEKKEEKEFSLCEELGIPRRPDFSGVPTNEQLDEDESYLAEKKEEKELALCEELGIPRRPDFSGVPTNEHLDEDESYLAEKKEEKELALCEELGIPRRSDFSGVPTNEQLDEDESYLAEKKEEKEVGMPQVKDYDSNKLKNAKRYLEQKVEEYCEIKKQRMDRLARYKTQELALCEELGIPRRPDFSGVPTNEQLDEYESYLAEKKEEKELALCEELGIPRRSDFSGVPTNEQLDEDESYLAEKKEEKELALCEELGIPHRPDFSGVPTNEQLDEDESYLAEKKEEKVLV